MGVIETRTFKSGNSVAVRLPRELGFDADAGVTLEKVDGGVLVRPAVDPQQQRRALVALLDELQALGPIDPPKRRIQPEAPRRRGL